MRERGTREPGRTEQQRELRDPGRTAVLSRTWGQLGPAPTRSPAPSCRSRGQPAAQWPGAEAREPRGSTPRP